MDFVSSSVSNSINSLRSQFKSVIDIVDPQFDVDATNKDSVKPVAQHVFNIAKDVLQGIELYDICTQVSKNLLNYSKRTNERIITWEEFSKICNNDDKAKLNAIAMSLNESGNIIYINTIKYIILDPNWFCNEIMGSLIHFPKSKISKGTILFENGCIPQHSLEEKLDFITRSKVKGSFLVDLMEAMHMCCKLDPVNHGIPRSNQDFIFVPSMLTDGLGMEQLQWRLKPPPGISDDDYTFLCMGRRLECKDKNLTFLTPGLFPRIQVLFNNAFQSEDDKAKVTLGKDFISIRFPKSEIIIVLCQAQSNYVIDVLVRAQSNTNENTLRTLAFVEKHIINTLITISAQPTGIQGVKLIESVIRPDCLSDPSNAPKRENQCVKITYLKEQLREKFEEGKEEFYDWKCTRDMTYHSLTSAFIDLLGSEYYEEVFNSCKQWFEVEVEDTLLDNDKVNVSRQYQSRENVITTNLENQLAQEAKTSEDTIEVQSTKFMVRSILSLHRNLDATHEEVLKLHDKVDQMSNKLEEIHKDLKCMREDVINKVEKTVSKLLEMALDNEAEKQLPRVAFLMFKFRNSTFQRLMEFVAELLDGEFVTIHLYCEHKKLPHPVKDQPGITLTCLSESQLKTLNRALPYINGFLRILIIAARLGISSVVPLASSIPNWSSHFKQLGNGYPLIQNTIKSKKDTYLSTLESASKEWQKCLALILEENGGLSEENILKKFLLKCAKYEVDGRTQVAWLCETHYQEKGPFH